MTTHSRTHSINRAHASALSLVVNIQSNCDQLRETFDRITQLEAFISLVKRNVQQMDDQVTAVERGFALQPLRNVKDAISGRFNSLLKVSYPSRPRLLPCATASGRVETHGCGV
jgi:hypothetical protein